MHAQRAVRQTAHQIHPGMLLRAHMRWVSARGEGMDGEGHRGSCLVDRAVRSTWELIGPGRFVQHGLFYSQGWATPGAYTK